MKLPATLYGFQCRRKDAKNREAELNDRLHERTQGFLQRAAESRRREGLLAEALREVINEDVRLSQIQPGLPNSTFVRAVEALKTYDDIYNKWTSSPKSKWKVSSEGLTERIISYARNAACTQPLPS